MSGASQPYEMILACTAGVGSRWHVCPCPSVGVLGLSSFVSHVDQALLHVAVAMSGAARVDLQAADKGLASCLALSNVTRAWADAFIAHHRLESLEDFIYIVDRSKWESSLKELADEVAPLRDNRLALARLKAAYESGHAAIQNAQAVDKSDASDLDQPIPDNYFQQLDQEWKRSYGIRIEAHLDPSDSLRGRIWRELRRRSLTLLDMKKVKSVVGGSSPMDEERITLEGGVSLQFAKEGYSSPKNTIEYYLRLRTLCYAWAFCGNFKQKCLDGTDRLVMPLEVALNYADFALRHTSSYGSGALHWLQRNDTLTRGNMCAKVRRGLTAAVALEEALREAHLEWRSPGVRLSEPSVFPETPERPSKRKFQDLSFTPPPPAPPKGRALTVSMAKGGRKLCKPWNDGRGCTNKNCDDLHACDIRLPDGSACMSRSHSRLNHPSS